MKNKYLVIGYVNNERHNLGCTETKQEAFEWAQFNVEARGYDKCTVEMIIYEFTKEG